MSGNHPGNPWVVIINFRVLSKNPGILSKTPMFRLKFEKIKVIEIEE